MIKKTAHDVTCWTCGDPVRNPMMVATHEGAHLESSDFPHDFRPIVWRLTHKVDECIPASKNDVLTTPMPQTPVAWLQMTIRLLDQKGEWFLFKISNWRYVLDCAQWNQGDGNWAAINDYENPKPERSKKADPETVYPDGRKPKKVVRRRPRIVRKKKV